jgi:hypothetical protein
MPTTTVLLDTLFWAAANRKRSLSYYSDGLAGSALRTIVVGDDEPIDPDQSMTSPGAAQPTRGFAPGSTIVPEFCEQTDGVTVKSQAAYPYAEILVDPVATQCAAPTVVCDLAVTFALVNDVAQLSVDTTHGPWSSSRDGVTYTPGLDTYPCAVGEEFIVHVRDAAGCTNQVQVFHNGGPGGEDNPVPPGVLVHTFSTSAGQVLQIYYLNDNGARTLTAYDPAGGPIPSPVTAQELGFSSGAVITEFTEGGFRIKIVARYTRPFAAVQVTALPAGPALQLVSLTPFRPEAVPPATGRVQILVSGGTAPLQVSIPGITAAPVPLNEDGFVEVEGLAPDVYTADIFDSSTPVQRVLVPFNIPAFVAPVVGCFDEEAQNYDPLVTEPDNSLCVFAPQWRSLWPALAVPVVLSTDPLPAYITAELYAGLPPGHPKADARPLRFLATLRATVSPRTGTAMVDVAPYLRPLFGALQSDGSRRLDINGLDAFGDDLYSYFRLKVGGVAIRSGYVLNSALPEAALVPFTEQGVPLTPFGRRIPAWPGFAFPVPLVVTAENGRYGYVVEDSTLVNEDAGVGLVHLPCPRNPVPVRWFSQEGGYGHWVFSGRPVHGDAIDEGQLYTEAGTGELRYSDPGLARRTLQVSSGPFSGRTLVEGLRTLRRAVQVWYQPELGGPWVPVVLARGTFPAYRDGVHKYQFDVVFTEAVPQYAQGQ